jgi:hypothetical protein
MMVENKWMKQDQCYLHYVYPSIYYLVQHLNLYSGKDVRVH